MNLDMQNRREENLARFNGPIIDRKKMREANIAAVWTGVGVIAAIMLTQLIRIIL